jgi:hypothetical protein
VSRRRPSTAAPERVAPLLVAMYRDAADAVQALEQQLVAARGALAFVHARLGTTYALRPGDVVEDDGRITRAPAAPAELPA